MLVFLAGTILTLAELGVGGESGPTAAPNTLDYGLVGYWDMEEGSGQVVKDKSGNGNDGVLGSSSSEDSADPVFGPGHDSSGEGGAGLKFDGRDDYANLGHGSNLTSNSGFTYSFWIKWSGANNGGYGGLVEYLNRGIQNSRILIVDSSSRIIVQDSTGTPLTSNYVFSKDTFYHIVLTWDGTLPYLYVNSILDTTGSVASFASAVSNDIKIGVGADWSPTYYFNGSIDEIRIYNRAISEDEVRQLYNQKKPILEMNFDEGSGNLAGDKSINNNYAILGGGTAAAMPSWATGRSGSALDFDGTDDFVEVKGTPSSWDLSLASYDYKNFYTGSQEVMPRDIFFSSDGSWMYIIGAINVKVFQYALSVPWDTSTASYSGKSFSTGSQEGNPMGIFLSPDGTKLYAIGDTNDTIYQYSLSIPWDISTASYESKSFSVATQDTLPNDLFFRDDGYRVYIIGTVNDTIYQYSLSAPWDISTASYDSKSFSIAVQENTPSSFYIKNDGSKMYAIGTVNDTIYQYSLSVPWDISTASYDSNSFSVAAQDVTPRGLFLSLAGDRFYILGYESDTIYQYGFYDEDSLDVTGAITLSGWVRIDDLSQRMALFGKGVCQTGFGNYGYFLSYYNGNNSIYWDTYSTTARDFLTYEISDTGWHFLTATWDGTTNTGGKKLYIDGVLVNQKTSTISAIGNTDYDFKVGIDAEDRFPADSAIDSVRLYNYARTADQILTDYNEGKAVILGSSEQDLNYGLVGYWDMEEGSGQFVYDKSGNGNDGVFGASSSVDSADPIFSSGHDSSGENGAGIKFDGFDDSVHMGDASALDLSTELTINLWVNSSFITSGGLVGKTCIGGGAQDHHYKISNSGTALQFSIGDGDCAGAGTNDTLTTNGFFSGYQNKWVSVTATYNRGEMKFYRNGVFMGSKTSSITLLKPYSNGFEIGRYPNYDVGYFDGSIDEVRIYNRALSEDEIRQLYNQKKPILHLKMDEGSGADLNDESFNNYDAKVYNKINTAISATSNTLFDNDVAWTTNEWAGHEVSIIYGIGVGQTRAVVSNTDSTLTVSSNWDIIPNNTSRYAITLDSLSVWTQRYEQSAINLSNVGYVGFAPDTAPVMGTGSFTLETWIKTSASSVQYIMQQRDNSDITGEYALEIRDTGNVRYWDYAGSIAHNFTSEQIVNDNVWHHIVFTRNGRQGFIFVDGILGGTSDVTAVNISSALDFAIGCDFRDAGSYFNGSLDDIRVYNYARTADEILVDYNEGKAAFMGKNNQDLDYGLVGYWDMEEGGGQTVYDKSGNGNDGTLGSSSSIESADPVFGPGHDSSGENGTGMVFDGVDDYTKVGDSNSLDIADEITLSAWVKRDESDVSDGIVFKNHGYLLAFDNVNHVYFNYHNGTSWVGEAHSSVLITDLDWHHVVASYKKDRGTVQIFVDGEMSKETSVVADTIAVDSYSFFIGHCMNWSDSWHFAGSIDEVRVYNRALSDDEIRQLYNQKKPVLEMKLDEGSGSTAYDESFNNNDGALGGGTAGYVPVWVDGKFGSALEFDGVDDYVDAGAGSSLDITKEVTLEGWFNSDNAWDTHVLFGKNRAYYIALVYPNTLRAYVYTADYNLRYSSSIQGLYAINNWYHVALCYEPDFGYIKLYLDGKEVEYETAQSKTDTINITTNHFLLGSNFLASAGYDGTLDDVRVYNYARSDAEILADYNAGLAAHLR
ncbi:MAG: LamG domain-containing protein [Candidatus Pacebacteria bacterium]|nr:LamG domain-containing protein [Candidatus Paceibacterota bacterium]